MIKKNLNFEKTIEQLQIKGLKNHFIIEGFNF